MPQSRPMPAIGPRCHELRIRDENQTWRIAYRVDEDAVLVLQVFSKKTQQTSKSVIENCKAIFSQYDAL
jgi:phage-related protein